jgi:hypothetical protein
MSGNPIWDAIRIAHSNLLIFSKKTWAFGFDL